MKLQSLLNALQGNYEFLKYQQSLIDAKKAQKRAVAFERLPNLKTDYEINIGSDNSLPGPYYTFGTVPTVNGGIRNAENMNPAAGSIAVAGLEWEAVNFGGYKSRLDVARSEVNLQQSALEKNRNDVFSIASSWYFELLKQFELTTIQQENVTRLGQLKKIIDALVASGVRPGVDSAIATAELSKANVLLLQSRKDLGRIQQRLAEYSGLKSANLVPDTLSGERLLNDGLSWTLTSAIDTLNHPDINYYNSLYALGKARYNADKNAYYPKVLLNVAVWTRSSSISYNDHFESASNGFVPERWNYLAAVSFTYDIFNIARKRLKMSVDKYETEAVLHRLNDEKENLKSEIQELALERDFQLSRESETLKQLNAANSAYQQQLSLYRNGLSSFIDVSSMLNYYIQAEREHLDARVGLMKVIISYSLSTNSFNSLIQTLNL